MSAKGFTARYAAYTADLALLTVPVLALAWSPLQRLAATWRALEAQTQAALDRAFGAGHFALLDLVAALRADAAFMAAMGDAVAGILGALLTAAALGWIAVAAYFIGFEASSAQATPGKRALGLRVTALDGRGAGFGRAALRFVAAGPSWLLLHLGHALVAFRDDDRAAHDLVAGTRVSGTPDVLPGWARAWLAAQTLAVGLLLAWVAWSLIRAVLLLGL